MEAINLNLTPEGRPPILHASQFDKGREFKINLFDGFAPMVLDGTETLALSIRKPDTHVVTDNITNTHDSFVEFSTSEQMTACAGDSLCEIKITKGADELGTLNFILRVEEDPLNGGLASDSEIINLQTQVDAAVAVSIADQYDSANVIFDAAPTPGHGSGYAVTSEGVATAIGNATPAASAVTYDNTNSHLIATDAQSAIDELDTGLNSLEADKVAFDNTGSGWGANDVQNALDTVADLLKRPSGSGGPLAVLGYYDIPAAVMQKKFVIIALFRYSYGNTVILPVSHITAGNYENGIYIPRTDTEGWTLIIETNGQIVLSAKGASTGEPYIEVWGID